MSKLGLQGHFDRIKEHGIMEQSTSVTHITWRMYVTAARVKNKTKITWYLPHKLNLMEYWNHNEQIGVKTKFRSHNFFKAVMSSCIYKVSLHPL